MCEFTAVKTVLPSFDIELLITNVEQMTRMKVRVRPNPNPNPNLDLDPNPNNSPNQFYLALALAMTCWFCMLELVELSQAG